ncbi:MAG TPA: hypothetical protein VMV00_00525 [Candidatus Baltobacteraceae bacterium]|nr:hypothetical protein [Candidatus Baltobacteraceae bacterium]
MASDNIQMGIGIVVIILVLASVAILSSQISALKGTQTPVAAQMNSAGIAANVSAVQSQLSAMQSWLLSSQDTSHQTGVSIVNLQGFVLPANSSRVVYDLAGLGGAANLEFNARIAVSGVAPGEVQLQFLNASQLAAGTESWLSVPTLTSNGPAAGTFPVQALGDLHNDQYGVSAVRIVNLNQTANATFLNGDMLSITVSCMTSHNPC